MLALALALGMAAHAMAAEDPYARRRAAEPVRPNSYSPHLRANALNAERYVVKGVCERDGIREIAQILQSSAFEEMWAFLPRARDSDDCEWHEIGRDERDKRSGATLRVDMGYLMELIAEHTHVQLVHFHPRRFFECVSRDNCPQRAATAAPIDQRWITDLVFAMPSPSDVHFMMNVTSRFFRRHQGHGTIRHKVVTPYGVVDYGLTEQGLAKYDAERLGRSEGLYIAWVAASALDDDRVGQFLKENPGSLSAAVPRLAQALNTQFLRVVHTAPPTP